MPSNVSNEGGDGGGSHGSQGGDNVDVQGVVSHVCLPSRRGMFCFYSPVCFVI